MLRRIAFMPLALMTLAPAAHAAFPPVRPITLPNGLRVVLAPDSLAASADIALWVHAGTRWERAGQSGATHLLERIAIDGSWSAAVARALGDVREAGGVHSTYTTADVASAFVTSPPDALPAALRAHAGMLVGLTLTPAQLASEKRGASESIGRRGDGGVVGRALQRLHAEHYRGHAYALQVTGDTRERDALPLADLQSWGARRFSPANALLTMTGRFQPDSALAAIRRTLGAVPRRAPPTATPVALPAFVGPRRATLEVPGRVALLVGGWRAPGGTDSARVVLPVLSRLLAQGARSRLSLALVAREPAPCLRLEGALGARAAGSLLYFVAVVGNAADTSAIDSTVAAEAWRLAAAPVSEEELERAKREVELRALEERQSARGRALAYGTAWSLSGRWESADEDLVRLRALTAEDVRAVAEQVLRPQGYAAVWVLPPPVVNEGEVR